MTHVERAQAIYDRLLTIPVPMAPQPPKVLIDDERTESLVPVYSRTALYPAEDSWSLHFHLGDDWTLVMYRPDRCFPRPPGISPVAAREIAVIDAALDGLVVAGIAAWGSREHPIVDAINAAYAELG